MRTETCADAAGEPPKSSTLKVMSALCPTMLKRVARTTVSLRSRSFGAPVRRTWNGAPGWKVLRSGASWTSPSVMTMAPATRSGGASARAAFSAAKRAVPPASPASALLRTSVSRTSICMALSLSRKAVSAFSASACLVPISMLCGERSITRATILDRPSRDSLTIRGLASASMTTASANTRAQAPCAWR